MSLLLFSQRPAGMERMQQVVGRARAAFSSGRCRSLEFRLQQLKNLERMVREKEKEILAALQSDLHKVCAQGRLAAGGKEQPMGLPLPCQVSLDVPHGPG